VEEVIPLESECTQRVLATAETAIAAGPTEAKLTRFLDLIEPGE
jgi:hypothetical protein